MSILHKLVGPLSAVTKFVPSDVPQADADSLITLYRLAHGPNWTNKTNWLIDPVVDNWNGITVSGGRVTGISLPLNGLNGLIELWTLPSEIITVNLQRNTVSGDLYNLVLPSTLTSLYANNTIMSGVPNLTTNVALSVLQMHSSGLSQSNVDAVLAELYSRRLSFTAATPTLSIGGTNPAPSGVYQDASPPTTGKEYAYKLIEDPDVEGFNKWTITYTA